MQADLRLLLLCFGVVFVGWIVWDALRHRKSDSLLKLENLEDSHTADPLMDMDAPAAKPTHQERTRHVPSALIAVSVMSYSPAGIPGDKLHAAIKQCGLCWHPRGLYHRHEADDPSQPLLFTLASATEPGVFDPSTRYFDATSGILLFMEGFNAKLSIEAFDDMVSTARQLSSMLGCQLCDDRREPLTIQGIEQLRAKLLDKLHTKAA